MEKAFKILSRIVLIGFICALFSLGYTNEVKADNVEIQKVTESHASIDVQQYAVPGDEVTFTITPEEGYYISNLSVDSGAAIEYQVVGSNNNPSKPMQYKFTVPDDAHTVIISVWGIERRNQIVYFVCDGNGTTSPSTTQNCLVYEEIDVTATPDPGNIFTGWTATQGTFEDASSASTTYTLPLADATTVTAHFADAPTYTVTFEPNGGNFNGSTTAATRTTGTDGKLTDFPEVQRNGFTFDGWFDDATSTTTRVGLDKVYSGATTLTAHWTETPSNPVCTGASIDAPSRVVKGQSYTIPVTFTFNRGLTVNDYADVAGKCSVEASPDYKSSNPRHSAGNNNFFLRLPITIPSDSTSENLTIRAKYNGTVEATATIPIDGPAPTNHTVTYKVVHGKWNDGSTGTKSETVADNAHLEHIPSVGSKPDDGYKAGSWSPSTPSSSTAITEDIEYTYTYVSESAKTYTVTASDDGHGSAKASPTSGETGTKVTITATPDKDHQFKEWKVIKGGVELADKKKKVTTFTIKDSNVEVKAIFDEEEDDDDDEDDEDHTPSWVLNPNEKQQLVITFAGNTAGLTAGYQEQGEVAQGLFKKETPAGYQKAFSFNILKDGKPDYSLKKGTLTLIIPPEYRKAGRQFAILAMGRNGQVIYLPDSDTDPNTVTVSLNLEGYALQLIYSD